MKPGLQRKAAAAIALWLTYGGAAWAREPLRNPTPPEWRQAQHAMLGPVTWDQLIEQLRQAEVVFLGEQHGDPGSHHLELALLQSLHERLGKGRRLVLSMEMFETDVQSPLDSFLAGKLSPLVFNLATRPWPNHARDYQPLLDFARQHGIPVVAANVPRPIAALVAKKGLAVLEQLSAEQRRWVAKPEFCATGEPWQRFQTVVSHHGTLTPEQKWRMYEAQCVKDATMARSIATALAPGNTLVLHVQGRFHSDYGQGVPAHLKGLLSDIRQQVVTAEPLNGPLPEQMPDGLADVVVYLQAPAAKATP